MAKIDLHKIKNILFDLGGVILNINMNASIKAFQSLGFNQSIINTNQTFSHKFFSEFQNGELSVTKFYDTLRNTLGNPAITDEQIAEAWNKMIIDIPAERVQVLKELNEKYNIYLFSNTNAIHIEKLETEFHSKYGFNFHSLFKKVYYSHKIFDSKPKVSSYLKVVKDAGIIAEESLFIDDLEKNIIGAQMAGLKGFWLQPGMEITQLFNSQSTT